MNVILFLLIFLLIKTIFSFKSSIDLEKGQHIISFNLSTLMILIAEHLNLHYY